MALSCEVGLDEDVGARSSPSLQRDFRIVSSSRTAKHRWRFGGCGGGESVRGLGSALTLGHSARDVVAEERVAPRWDRWQMSNNVVVDRGGLGERVASGAHWVHDGG